MMARHINGAIVGVLVAGNVACVALGGDPAADTGGSLLSLTTLSSRPDVVTGGDALVRIDAPDGVALSDIRVELNGADITDLFKVGHERQGFVGLVDGLVEHRNDLSVSYLNDTVAATETLVNHPMEGPVISGPHEQPFVCETEDFELPSGDTLGAPLDQYCSVERRVDYAYRSSLDGTLKPLPNSRERPADLATTTTIVGTNVPYIVRFETGAINRAIYQIAMLHDPATDPDPDAWTPSPGWNGRLIYTFGGGCVNGWYRQGSRTGGVTDDVMLRQGYAVASSTLNVYGNNCNDVLAAETMMMVKERFVEAYGMPRYTIGWGCSGGAYQNHQIADNYPGLLDGIIPGCSFPDVAFGTIPMITDARLLNRYFKESAGVPFADTEQRAVAGFLMLATMPNVSRNAGRINVSEFCPDVLPTELRYHQVDNPDGVRCDVYDHYVNIYGRDPVTGFARRPLDNVGVQYGLAALNDGVITTAQFLDINERIGGYDNDGNHRSERSVADVDAIRIAYETGRLTSAGGGLATTPIIDYRGYSDDRENGDVHVRYHSFSMRERLREANGRTDNHIMLVEDARYGLYSSQSPVLQGALRQMDQWLENLAADTSDDPQIKKVVRAKPPELVDACWSRDDDPKKINEPQIRGSGRCNELYPSPPSPREVAGAPLASDIVKCQLKEIELADYAVSFTSDEMERLRTIFRSGVCNWSSSGVGQTGLKGTWLTFASAQ